MKPTLSYSKSIRSVALICATLLAATATLAQTTAFTYQGRLTDEGTPANGNYDLQFALWTSSSGGTQVGSTQTINTVAVSNGVFTVSLDFGANAFPGASRFLEISTRPAGSGSFTTLTPRQPITSTPYAVRSLNSATADSVPASGVPAGSGNYIQNSTSPQATSNFNISGNGTVGGNLIATGNVGIGTTTPLGRLHVRGDAAIFDNPAGAIRVTKTLGVLSNDDLGIWNRSGGGGQPFAIADWNTGTQGIFLNTSTGRVGIGTTSPGAKLDANSADGTVAIIGTGPTRAVIGRLGEISCPGSGNRPYAVGGCGGSTGSGVMGRSSVGQDFFHAAVYAISDGGGLIFQGLAGTASKATIDANGNLFLAGSLSQNSDVRMKQGVANLSYGLREVLQLRPVTWTWKQQPERGRQLGLIAQEVETVLPELVTTEKNAEQTKALNYIGLEPVLIKAIQEQQATIAALQAENAALNARVQAIEQALQELAKKEQSERAQKAQQQRLDALKNLVCQANPQASLCQDKE